MSSQNNHVTVHQLVSYYISDEPFECKLGVRQGECLSPFLFAMYINDLESHLCTSQ